MLLKHLILSAEVKELTFLQVAIVGRKFLLYILSLVHSSFLRFLFFQGKLLSS